MKMISSALLGVLALAAGAATAAAQQQTPATPRSQTAAHGARGQHGAWDRGQRGLFQGIQLDANEQARVKAVQQKYASQLEAERKADAPRMKAMRDARQRGDTAAVRSLRASMKGDREQGSAVRQQMERDLRGALTPEHQSQFDGNVAKQKSRLAQRGNGANHHRGAQRGGAAAV